MQLRMWTVLLAVMVWGAAVPALATFQEQPNATDTEGDDGDGAEEGEAPEDDADVEDEAVDAPEADDTSRRRVIGGADEDDEDDIESPAASSTTSDKAKKAKKRAKAKAKRRAKKKAKKAKKRARKAKKKAKKRAQQAKKRAAARAFRAPDPFWSMVSLSYFSLGANILAPVVQAVALSTFDVTFARQEWPNAWLAAPVGYAMLLGPTVLVAGATVALTSSGADPGALTLVGVVGGALVFAAAAAEPIVVTLVARTGATRLRE